MLSSVKRLLVTMVVFSSFFSSVLFLSNVLSNSLSKMLKSQKLYFQKFFYRVISNVYTNALLETMLNQNGFICAKFLQIRFVNVTPFDRPEEIHCTTLQQLRSSYTVVTEFCFVTIPLVDAATLFCLEITAAEETKELFIICKVAFFTDLTRKIGVFRCKFYFPKILPV